MKYTFPRAYLSYFGLNQLMYVDPYIQWSWENAPNQLKWDYAMNPMMISLDNIIIKYEI